MKKLMLAGAATLVVTACGSDTPEERAAKLCKDSIGAWAASQRYVKANLKSPSSAEFDSMPVAAEHISDCNHRVVGQFEAQNSFGAMIRQRYSATMTYEPSRDEWVGSDLNIQ